MECCPLFYRVHRSFNYLLADRYWLHLLVLFACFNLIQETVSYTRIKICGLTRPEDVTAVTACGVDAIGLVFYGPSSRAVNASQAKKLLEKVPPFVTAVGLFVDAPATELRDVLAQVSLDLLQFHGEESATYCEQFGLPYLKALRVRPGMDIAAEASKYSGACGILLDTWHEGAAGGTGESFDWSLVPAQLDPAVVLAGGLTADSVGAAIAQLRPYAVDVCSASQRHVLGCRLMRFCLSVFVRSWWVTIGRSKKRDLPTSTKHRVQPFPLGLMFSTPHP